VPAAARWHHQRVAILVIEDEPELAESLRRGLLAEGWSVDVAHDGGTGLELAREHAYQLIICDLMLPVLNGYRVCAALRKAGVTTPVLVLTAKDGEYDEADALDIGADDYLSKPFSYVVLVARLRALIRRGGSARPTTLRVGDLWLDPATRRCRRGEVDVPLTAKEFAVLSCLSRRPGEVVSKTEIIDEVWDTAFDGDVNIVEVYVRTLRRKIDLPFGRRSIETVRGAGYRLVQRG
jgi:DNA-binding response OmpR family regulator